MKNIAILGLGVSGLSALKLAHSKGFHVLAFNDGRPKSWKNFNEIAALIPEKNCLNEQDVSREKLQNLDFLVVSPGVPENNPVLLLSKESEIKIISELEFAYSFLKKEKIIAITGTNGKTTTCTMLSQLLERAGVSHFLGGNIGTPLSEYVLQGDPVEFLVLELSSFQLERVSDFHADYACILNIQENHMERYKSFEDYASAKFNIFNKQGLGDISIIPEQLKVFLKKQLHSKLILINQEKIDEIKNQYAHLPYHFVGNYIWVNLCFVYTLASSMKIPKLMSSFEDLIKNFKGIPHRLQFVATKEKISFYNDAKSTNWFATQSALDGLKATSKIILILGGKSRDGKEALLDSQVISSEGLEKILLIGETSESLKKVFASLAHECGNLEKAFEWISFHVKGDATVVFSPAYPSFDQYQNYEQRGEHFIREVADFKKR